MTSIARRDVLSFSTGVLAMLAGCGAFDYSRHRVLGFGSVVRQSEGDGKWAYEVVLSSSSSGGDRKWQTFHEVELVAFDDRGVSVGAVGLGAVFADGEHEPVTITCSSQPVVMTFSAVEGPCDSNTEVEVVYYRGSKNGREIWSVLGNRECGEGLPPEPLTPTEES